MDCNHKGFTLIELLVVIAIIGILSSIGLSQYQSYRARAFDAGAQSDLRNGAAAEEAYFIDNDAYLTCGNVAVCLASLTGLKSVSPTVDISFQGTTTSFTGIASSSAGSGIIFTWDSAGGGLQ